MCNDYNRENRMKLFIIEHIVGMDHETSHVIAKSYSDAIKKLSKIYKRVRVEEWQAVNIIM